MFARRTKVSTEDTHVWVLDDIARLQAIDEDN